MAGSSRNNTENRRHAYFTELTLSKALFYAGKQNNLSEAHLICYAFLFFLLLSNTNTNDTLPLLISAAAVFYCATVLFLAVFEPFMEISCVCQGERKEHPNPD